MARVVLGLWSLSILVNSCREGWRGEGRVILLSPLAAYSTQGGDRGIFRSRVGDEAGDDHLSNLGAIIGNSEKKGV